MSCFCLQLNAMRKQIKPISGQLGSKRKQEAEQLLHRSQPISVPVEDKNEPRRRGMANKRQPSIESKDTTPKRSPAVSRNAKKKWEMLERKVSGFKNYVYVYRCISRALGSFIHLSW